MIEQNSHRYEIMINIVSMAAARRDRRGENLRWLDLPVACLLFWALEHTMILAAIPELVSHKDSKQIPSTAQGDRKTLRVRGMLCCRCINVHRIGQVQYCCEFVMPFKEDQ